MRLNILGFDLEISLNKCEKVDYKSKETAEKSAIAMNKKPSTKNELEAYRCYICGGWHLGRKMK